MRCPFCATEGHRRAIHAHLAAEHGEKVVTTDGPVRWMELACPDCDHRMKRIVKPRGRDPGFMEEHAREIRLVAFDQLLLHIETAHPLTEVKEG